MPLCVPHSFSRWERFGKGLQTSETLEVARKAREAFLLKWKKQCPGVAALLEEAGEDLLTFYRLPESQWRSLRTTNAIERMQLEFRRRVKTQAARPNEGAVLRVFFGLWISGQMKLHRISGYRDIGGRKSCCLKKEFHDFTGKMRYSLFYRFRDTTLILDGSPKY